MIELLESIARAGGGGSGSGGGGAGVIVLPLIAAGMVASWWTRKRRIQRAKSHHKAAVAKDSSWSEQSILQIASDTFYAFQKDWSDLNAENMKAYLTPRYHTHITLMLAALWQMHRRNDMREVRLDGITLFDVHDNADDELDRFAVEIKAAAIDNLMDTATNRLLHGNWSDFEELWHFEREGQTWMLDSISQINKDGLVVKYDPKVDRKYLEFAKHNNFFYNADFGWLLMPLHGMLFSAASYGHSDINHHVIGLYHNIVVQFFEYVPLIRDKASLGQHLRYFYKANNTLAKYTIAHVTLPRSYGNIIVERRKFLAFFSMKPQGLTKVSLEWPQFNKLFNVFTADMDRVASLELLHPAFMERLAALPFRVNLEIVGSDLYLYSTDMHADYQTMLQILKKAFEEMKM